MPRPSLSAPESEARVVVAAGAELPVGVEQVKQREVELAPSDVSGPGSKGLVPTAVAVALPMADTRLAHFHYGGWP